MGEIPQILNWIIGSAAGAGILMAGLGYGYGQFKRGQQEVDEQTFKSLQRQLDTLKLEMTELKTENKDLAALNNQLQGQLVTYKEIALNQNPELKEVLRVLAETVPPLLESVQYCRSRSKIKETGGK